MLNKMLAVTIRNEDVFENSIGAGFQLIKLVFWVIVPKHRTRACTAQVPLDQDWPTGRARICPSYID